jgi:hypothetical protein
LINLKNKLEVLNIKEESVNSELQKFSKFDKNVDELFKEEIDKYKIEDSMI